MLLHNRFQPFFLLQYIFHQIGLHGPHVHIIRVFVVLGDRRISFTMNHQGAAMGTVELSVPGKHNVYNAMATVITCLEAGISFEKIVAAIIQN